MAVCNVPTCTQSIVTGTRYHCDTCDVDFCQSCYYTTQKDPKTRHIHPLRPMLVSGSSTVQPLTEEQRRERNRSIQLHLQLLLHSARDCIGKKCASKNCEKMKEFLKHEPTCKVCSNLLHHKCPNTCHTHLPRLLCLTATALRSAVHIAHHLTAAVIHLKLLQLILPGLLLDLCALGHRTVVHTAPTRMQVQQVVHLFAGGTAFLDSHTNNVVHGMLPVFLSTIFLAWEKQVCGSKYIG
jgi:hypothetical protein